MNIAIIAHDKKKELMVQFCIAYCGILSRHNICSTGSTGRLVAEATGLNIQTLLSGQHGGDQQVGARIAYNEIDLVIVFRDSSDITDYSETDFLNIIRLCDINNVPIATNIATAESLILSLGRGDLDWREYINKK